jgi:3-hydroxy-9,10-secoandrosta-1,3,5(10)-triene-9,17-dione monooxygenase
VTDIDLLARARALVPTLAERAARTDALRRLPDETVDDLREAGFFRMLQPERWGGLEVHPRTFFDVQRTLASACPATAWVLGVVGVHAWQLALFADEAQQDVWADDPSVRISSSYAPTGKIKRVDGGYRVSGRWSFSSGCDHCTWVFLGGFAPVADGAPPDMRTFLLPRRDYAIDDTWHTMALRGTGSKDIVVNGAFVPEHRTHRLIDGYRCASPGNAVHPAPLYRLPFGQIFVRSVSTTTLGILEGALGFYRDVTATRVGVADANKASLDPDAQMVCARAASALDRCVLVLHRNLDVLMDHAERGVPMPVERRVAFRWDSSEAVETCVAEVDRMFTMCGGRAIFLNSPMHRFFVDAHGARAHYANRPEASGRNFGRVQLGNKTQDYFL